MRKLARVFFLSLLSMPVLVAQTGTGLVVEFSRKTEFGAPSVATAPKMVSDASGNVYLLEYDWSNEVPATWSLAPAGEAKCHIVKFSALGGVPQYVTKIGFRAHGIAGDREGNAYLYDNTRVVKINRAGTGYVFQMPVPQGLTVLAMAVDPFGVVYVAGTTSSSTALATTANAIQKTAPNNSRIHAFVARLNAAGTGFDYATYLGGSGDDQVFNIAVDGSGGLVVSGSTTSDDFPVTAGAYRTRLQKDPTDFFLARIAPDGSRLIYSTFLEAAGLLTVNAVGVALVSNGNRVVSINPSGTQALYSKQLENVSAIGLDIIGRAYVVHYSATHRLLRKSLFSCGPINGSTVLTGFAGDGTELYSTYTAGEHAVAMVVSDMSTVLLLDLVGEVSPERREYAKVLTRMIPGDQLPVRLACLANAASFAPGGVAPGELISVFGDRLGSEQGVHPVPDPQSGFPTEVAGVQLTFGGKPAPIVYSQASQINAVVLWSLRPGFTTEVCVVVNGIKTECVTRLVSPVSPGVFTVDGRYAAALNEDGTINSATNPADEGAIVSIFATGLGPIVPAQPDGSVVGSPLPSNTLPVQITAFNGVRAAPDIIVPQYAGPAPGMVAGLSQVNFNASRKGLTLVVERLGASNGFLIHVKPRAPQ